MKVESNKGYRNGFICLFLKATLEIHNFVKHNYLWTQKHVGGVWHLDTVDCFNDWNHYSMVKIALLPTKLVLDENGTWSFQNKKIQDSFKSEGGNERLGFLTQNS